MYEFNQLLTRVFRQNGTGKQTDRQGERQTERLTERQGEQSTSTKARVSWPLFGRVVLFVGVLCVCLLRTFAALHIRQSTLCAILRV